MDFKTQLENRKVTGNPSADEALVRKLLVSAVAVMEEDDKASFRYDKIANVAVSKDEGTRRTFREVCRRAGLSEKSRRNMDYYTFAEYATAVSLIYRFGRNMYLRKFTKDIDRSTHEPVLRAAKD